MKYMGSKNRIAKHILPIILKDRKLGQWYVEPFVGGFNIIDKVIGKRMAYDINPYVIALFTGIQNGYIPPDTVSEEEYLKAKVSGVISPETAFIGFGCSYSGKLWGGYARGNTATGHPRNYCQESKNNILKQFLGIRDIFIAGVHSYADVKIPPNSIIYCDPPYRGATGYKDSINYNRFYQWCRDMKEQGHTIFISEYCMPEDFTCVWSMEQTSSLTQDTGSKRALERLYTL